MNPERIFIPTSRHYSWRSIIGLTLLMLSPLVCIKAQTSGTISGRVVTEDGNGLANVSVSIFPVGLNQPGGPRTALTDEEGNFRFTGLSPRSYSVSVYGSQGYVRAPIPAADRDETRYNRIGENINIILIRGGVITGRVVNAGGEPVIGIQVSATMVRDVEGNRVRGQFGGQPRFTDDRGIYRLYGLAPGSYIVVASGRPLGGYQSSPYDGEVPTYHPSSTRDTATEVNVPSGGETSGVDILYRGEVGHAVSGSVIGVDSGTSNTMMFAAGVSAYSPVTGALVGSTSARPVEGNHSFAIYGLPDGDYDLVAFRGGYDRDEALTSQPRRVTLKGADVTGVDLRLAPLASIAGKLVLENNPSSCESKGKAALEEIILTARRDERQKNDTLIQLPMSSGVNTLNEKGEFTIRNINPGQYRIEARLPGDNWYLKSITVPSAGPVRRTSAAAKSASGSDGARTGFTLKSGDKVTGVTVTLVEGAAGLRGKVVAEKEGARLPSRLRVHLVPSEAQAADDVIRYAETLVRGDGTFSFRNLAPGKYLLTARVVPDDEPSDRPAPPVAWDNIERAKLRKKAEVKKVEIELQPCQRVSDHTLRY